MADLAELLIKMGASIEGAGTSTIRVKGVDRLHGATHAIIPDRIEAGTFIVAAAITAGDVIVALLRARAPSRADRQAEAGGRGHYGDGARCSARSSEGPPERALT